MSGLHHQHSGRAMSPVVQIIASESFLYSLNNGISHLEYDPGEFYDVPDFVARGMISRGWAKLATPGEPGQGDPPKPAPPPPPVQEPHQQPKPEPQEDENDDDDDDKKGPAERKALQTKGKRR
jgi:hypothetical protein